MRHPRVAERYYIHVTEPHVTTGFDRFVSYLERRLVDSVPAVTGACNKTTPQVVP
jgi:hypothetical protein